MLYGVSHKGNLPACLTRHTCHAFVISLCCSQVGAYPFNCADAKGIYTYKCSLTKVLLNPKSRNCDMESLSVVVTYDDLDKADKVAKEEGTEWHCRD